MTNEELLDAIHNAATGSEYKRKYYGTTSATSEQALRLQRQFLRLLEDLEPELTVAELIDQLQSLENQ